MDNGPYARLIHLKPVYGPDINPPPGQNKQHLNCLLTLVPRSTTLQINYRFESRKIRRNLLCDVCEIARGGRTINRGDVGPKHGASPVYSLVERSAVKSNTDGLSYFLITNLPEQALQSSGNFREVGVVGRWV